MAIKIKKVMQSYHIPPDQIKKLSELQESFNKNDTNRNPISKASLVSEALDLLFKKYKI